MKSLSTTNLSKSFPHFRLNEVNVELEEGEFLGLLGKNGSGKSTFIRMLTGFDIPSLGDALVYGQSVMVPKKLYHLIGVVNQETKMEKHLTVREYITKEVTLRGLNRSAVDKAFSQGDLWEVAEERMEVLSLGSKRKAQIVRALVHSPKLLFLDEPTVGVDMVTRRWILNYLLAQKKERLSCVIVSHQAEEFRLLCDKILVFKRNDNVTNNHLINLKEESKRSIITVKISGFHPGVTDQFAQFTRQLNTDDRLNVEMVPEGIEINTDSDINDVLPFLVSEFAAGNVSMDGITIDRFNLERELEQ
jgi:ABC-type multidrug transport system ATPase subunit